MSDDVKKKAKAVTKEFVSAGAGTGIAVGSLSAAGIPGLSAAGITSGLAVLGAGSMLAGIGTVAAIGYGSYKLTRWMISSTQSRVG